MANKLLEERNNHRKQIEKLQKRLVYFTAIGSVIGCAFGSIFGYMAGKESVQKENTSTVQKITSQPVSIKTPTSGIEHNY